MLSLGEASTTADSVRLSIRDDAPYSTTRVGCVTLTARDQMDMRVRNRLTCGVPNVDAHVEALDVGILGRQPLPQKIKQPPRVRDLRLGELEEAFDVTARDDQDMAFGDRKRVGDGRDCPQLD